MQGTDGNSTAVAEAGSCSNASRKPLPGHSLPVNVCYIIDDLATAGTEMHLLRLIAGLDRDRFRPHLAILNGQDAGSRSLEPAGIPVVRYGVTALSRPASLMKLIRFSRQLRRWKIQILQTFFPDSTHFGMLAGSLARVPVLLRTKRDLFPWPEGIQGRISRRLCGWYNRFLVNGMLTNSVSCRNAVMALESPPPKEVAVIPNGVDVAAFDSVCFPPPLAETLNLVRIGAVANLRSEKRLDVLIKAVRMLIDRGFRATCTIAGKGPERAALEEVIHRAGLVDAVQLCGTVRDIPQFLSRIDIAVLCSDTEGASNALIEYMLAQRAIIATDVGGNREMIDDGVHGRLVPPGDASAMADAFTYFLTERQAAVRCAENASRKARQRFSLESEIAAHQDWYTQFLHAR